MTPAVLLFGILAALAILWLVRAAASQPVEDVDDEVAEERDVFPFCEQCGRTLNEGQVCTHGKKVA